jgi:NADH:ubiquinone oxidoreductase subunit C
MDTESFLNQVEEILKPWTRWSKRRETNVVEISVSRHNLLECISALRKAKWGYLSAVTGMHVPGVENKISEEKQWDRLASEDLIHSQPQSIGDSFVVLYHFCEGAAILNLRIHPPSFGDAVVPSICGLIPGAALYERELHEMFGIPVEGIPDSAHFLLPEDWPEGVYPLRKSFSGLPETRKA